MLKLEGRIDRIITEQVNPPNGDPFVSTTLVVLQMGASYFVRVGKDFGGTMPSEGTDVTLQVSARPYASKNGPKVGWTAHGVSGEQAEATPIGKRASA